MNNSVVVEGTKNSLVVDTFYIWSDYYFIQAAQVLQEDKEAGT